MEGVLKVGESHSGLVVTDRAVPTPAGLWLAPLNHPTLVTADMHKLRDLASSHAVLTDTFRISTCPTSYSMQHQVS